MTAKFGSVGHMKKTLILLAHGEVHAGPRPSVEPQGNQNAGAAEPPVECEPCGLLHENKINYE